MQQNTAHYLWQSEDVEQSGGIDKWRRADEEALTLNYLIVPKWHAPLLKERFIRTIIMMMIEIKSRHDKSAAAKANSLLVSQIGSYVLQMAQWPRETGASEALCSGLDWLPCSMNSLWNKALCDQEAGVRWPPYCSWPPNNAPADGSPEPPRSLVRCQSSFSNTSNLVHGRRTCLRLGQAQSHCEITEASGCF